MAKLIITIIYAVTFVILMIIPFPMKDEAWERFNSQWAQKLDKELEEVRNNYHDDQRQKKIEMLEKMWVNVKTNKHLLKEIRMQSWADELVIQYEISRQDMTIKVCWWMALQIYQIGLQPNECGFCSV